MDVEIIKATSLTDVDKTKLVDLALLELYYARENSITTTAISMTLNATHNVIIPTVDNLTILLPTAVSIANKRYIIKQHFTTVVTTNITAFGAETIEGDGTITLDSTDHPQTVELISDGTQWRILYKY
jgi:hypothetical protein